MSSGMMEKFYIGVCGYMDLLSCHNVLALTFDLTDWTCGGLM